MTTSTSLATSSPSSSSGASGSSLSPFRSFLIDSCNTARHLGATLNWRSNPDTERALAWLDKQHALLDWIESEIDLIEADLPSTSTPPPPIDASFSAS